MQKEIQLKPADNADRGGIITLLQSAKLPTEDLSHDLDNFFVAVADSVVIGAIGLEKYDRCGLLRSLIVDASYRNGNIAGNLISLLEKTAVTSGIECIYLLTQTVPLYFEKKGYQRIARDEAPEALRKSSEFSHVCPSSAILMLKKIPNNQTSNFNI